MTILYEDSIDVAKKPHKHFNNFTENTFLLFFLSESFSWFGLFLQSTH